MKILQSFTCDVCHETKEPTNPYNTGYGMLEDGRKACFACCAKIDRQDMIETGKATLYLSFDTQFNQVREPYLRAKITNWPGTLEFRGGFKEGRHNIAGKRVDVWFAGPDGYTWHGVQYGRDTQILRCKRTKRKAVTHAH